MSDEVVAPDASVIARNKLAAFLTPFVPELPWLSSRFLAVAHIEHDLGWRPPARVIETAEELRSLPNNSVVLGHMSGDVWEFTRISEDCSWWATPGREGTFEADSVDLPASVLWESGDPR